MGECTPCPLNAYCAFDWQTGSSSSMQCNTGFQYDANSHSCVSTAETAEVGAAAGTVSDVDTTMLIGVVSGCVALLALAGAAVYVVKSQQQPQAAVPLDGISAGSPTSFGQAYSLPGTPASTVHLYGNAQAETYM